MILLLDNFDSFTYNLVDYFGQLGVKAKVFRNDTDLKEIQNYSYQGIVLSPGPQSPAKAGHLMEVLDYYAGKLPVLGICLGHQAIGEYFGARLVKAQKPMHGKVSKIHCAVHPVFEGIPSPTEIVRYHSLLLENLPDCLEPIAWTDLNEVMAIKHNHLPITGLQFHPEAVLTTFGLKMLENWVKIHKIAG